MGHIKYAIGKNTGKAIELSKGQWLWLRDKKLTYTSLVPILKEELTKENYAEECTTDTFIEQLAHKILSVDSEFDVISDQAYGPDYVGVLVVASFYTDTDVLGKCLSTQLSPC